MNAVVLREVQKTYFGAQGDVDALGPLSFAMASGDTVAVVGPSGCGKSTLLRIVAGLDDRTGGEVVVAGRSVTAPIPEIGRAHV